MNSLKKIFLSAVLFVFIACTGAGNRENSKDLKKLRIVSWNVQTLFDGIADGTEYDGFVEGWTQEKYLARLNGIALAVEKIEKADSEPDVIALIEIEKARVLQDIADNFLKKYGYRWTFFGNNEGAALGIGVLSRFPFLETRLHSALEKGETIPRPVLEVWIAADEKPLALFVCHWKSKRGGDESTERQRRVAARIIARRTAEIKQNSPGTPVMILGDLNENYDEFYLRNRAYITALMADDEKGAELAAKSSVNNDFLVISGQKPPYSEYFTDNSAVFYSIWTDYQENTVIGSYYYQKVWETIDHFLLNEDFFDGKGWEFETCTVINSEPFVTGLGYPYRYDPKTGNGLSDHLPLMLTLKNAESE